MSSSCSSSTAVVDVVAQTLKEVVPEPEPKVAPSRLNFWLVFVSLGLSLFLSALEQNATSTALPTIVAELHGTEFVWASAAYNIAFTAFLPLFGCLAQIFGRKAPLLVSLSLFAIGSGVCGGAVSMIMLIVGRAVQGTGAGGIVTLSFIVVGDLVCLRDRGFYSGVLLSVFAVAAASAPPLSGALSTPSLWRWIFYLNLPLTGIALVCVYLFFNMRTPQQDLRARLARLDWIGNLIIIVASVSMMLALTWGGVKYSWSSKEVLIPLCFGLVGMIFFFCYEALWAKEPLVPLRLLTNRTSLSGYFAAILVNMILVSLVYFVPVYFQACKGSTPLQSGLYYLGLVILMNPVVIITGVIISKLNLYRPQNFLGWGLVMIGLGLLSILQPETPISQVLGFEVILGIGMGILFPGPQYAVLAPLPLSDNAPAMGLYSFLRGFSLTWGVTLSTVVLQNELQNRLPTNFISQFGDGAEIAYAIIPTIPNLAQPLQGEVQAAFADGLSVVWKVMIGVAGAGMLTAFTMKEIPMHSTTDDQWGLKGKAGETDPESPPPLKHVALEEEKTTTEVQIHSPRASVRLSVTVALPSR